MKTKSKIHLAIRVLFSSALALSAGAYGAATFTPNSQPTGWVGEVDVSSFNFADDNQTIYKGDYTKGDWAGNLYAYPVNGRGTVDVPAERWNNGVADNLDAQNYDLGRYIVTMKTDGTRIPFRWASLESHQQSALGNATNGPKILNYIRGDRSNESPSGALYRVRTHVLGDIVHSRPLYVADPSDPRVYVGANDGMLHAFDANAGTEVFAYLPSFFINPPTSGLFSQVNALTVSPYVHNYFVDASPNAAKITVSGSPKTILVGGAGAGGKGAYALDITDPNATSETNAANKILWEITPSTINNVANTSYADLGYTYGIPLIVTLSDGTAAALIANGYNGKGADQAVLYVVNLMTGAKIAGIATSVTGVSDTNPNGLSSPTAVDVDRDGRVDYVYAGDINGNLWKFDIRNISAPTVTKLYTTSPAQPITGRPSVALHPQGGYMVNFATGRMFTSADATDSTTVYYGYGLWDNNITIDPTKVVSQTLTAKTWTAGSFNYNVRVSASNTVDYTAGTGQKQGWKVALPAGERVVGDGGVITNSRYIFMSTNPAVAHAAVGGVAQPQGDNWLNEFDFLTGGGGATPIFDLDANLTLDDTDRVRDSGGTNAQSGPTGVPVSRYLGAGVISQPIVASLDVLAETYYNTNGDVAISTTASTGDPGVSGGHFDFDIYYPNCTVSNNYSCSKNTHVHEYDDKYDVTGVNMLAPSLAAFNLANAITSTSTQFKILMSNQQYSPAVKFLRGGLSGIPVTSFQTAAGLSLASEPTYTRANVSSLTVALPLDAFQSKDWSGTGDVRAGLVPTATGCVHANQGAGSSGTGPWMNGALTLQIVKSTTPDSAVELNQAGNPAMGYRLKKDATSQANQLAQYTIFWHHPNGKCVGDAQWVKNPPQDTSSNHGSATAAAAGAADPKDGQFGNSGGLGSGGGTGAGTSGASGVSTTVTYTFADGSSVVQTTTKNSDGSVTVTRVYSYGGSDSYTIPAPGGGSGPGSGGLQDRSSVKTGRVSWREVIRQ